MHTDFLVLEFIVSNMILPSCCLRMNRSLEAAPAGDPEQQDPHRRAAEAAQCMSTGPSSQLSQRVAQERYDSIIHQVHELQEQDVTVDLVGGLPMLGGPPQLGVHTGPGAAASEGPCATWHVPGRWVDPTSTKCRWRACMRRWRSRRRRA